MTTKAELDALATEMSLRLANGLPFREMLDLYRDRIGWVRVTTPEDRAGLLVWED